ncbi:MAG: SurA N-terminal domain-containing protein [Victivallaceae bacterium]|nr:SurA N-terminal domain-containing protein [Victivallaceae bacterium]
MLIGKINSVFAKHHRWLFGGIVMVVIVTFVFYFSSGSIFDLNFGGGGSSGVTVFGDKVSATKLGNQIRYNLINASLSSPYGLAVFQSEEAFSGAHASAPAVLGQLAMAEQRGLGASDEEVNKLLAMIFSVDNKFNTEFFNTYTEMLQRYGMTVDDLKTAVRQSILLNKLAVESSQSGLFAATDGLKSAVNSYLTNRYSVSLAKFKADDFIGQVAVDEAAIGKYYEEHQNAFMIPADCDAIVASISYNAPEIAAAAVKLAEDDAAIQNFYNANKQRYGEKTFDQIKVKVIDDFVTAAAADLAAEKIKNFETSVYEILNSGAATPGVEIFRNAAVKSGLRLKMTKTFNRNSPQVVFNDGSVIAGAAPVRVLSSTSSQIPLSDTFDGDNAICIGYVNTVKPETLAPLADVKAEISAILVRAEAAKLAAEAAGKAAAELMARPQAERAAAFAKLPHQEKLEFGFIPPSTANGELVAAVARGLAVNGVSSPYPAADGAFLVRLDAQTAGSMPEEFAKLPVPAVEWYLNQTVNNGEQLAMFQYLQANVTVPQDYMEAGKR